MIDLEKSAKELEAAAADMDLTLWRLATLAGTDEQRRSCAESLTMLKRLGRSMERTLGLLSKGQTL